MARAYRRSGNGKGQKVRSVARSASTGRVARTARSGRDGSTTGSTVEGSTSVKKMSPGTRAKFEQLLDQLNAATGGGDASPRP
ncbi:hypothetical protein AA0Y32_06855 [Georgenia phoenicis]|uniref:hypothetical protein n=1 Tax=unclassified Georgenia TaxID=2626815 RepID=UPI0039B0A3DA